MPRHSLLVSLFLLSVACGAPDLSETDPSAVASQRAPIGSKLVYFGRLEVEAGKLKSADGTLPRAGESATLRLFLPELGRFLCRDYCMALYPHLFVRFKGTEAFQEVPGIPQGNYVMRGPQESWPRDTTDVVMYFTSDADRIEIYMQWGRISWNGAACYLAYDVMECPDWFGISDAYLSNFGRNFRIDVAP
jgi:hypothetical protein